MILGIILVAFAFAFLKLFQPTIDGALREIEEDGEVMVDDGGEGYLYLSGSLVRVVGLMLGEFTPDIFDNSASPSLGVFLLVCYMLITPIILLNALIAIMGDSYDRVQANANAEWRCEQAKIVLELEQLLYTKQRKDPLMFPTWVHVLKPKPINEGDDEDASQQTQWLGRAGELKSFVRSELKESQSQLDTKLEMSQHQLEKKLETVKSAVDNFGRSFDSKLDRILARQAPKIQTTPQKHNDPGLRVGPDEIPVMPRMGSNLMMFGRCSELAEDISTNATTHPPAPPSDKGRTKNNKAGQIKV